MGQLNYLFVLILDSACRFIEFETLFHLLREEHKLMFFQNKALKTSGPERKVRVEWKNVHTDFHQIFSW